MAYASRDGAVARLKKIEGQVRGLARMLEEDRYCIDILQQMQAVKAALSKVEALVLQDHAANCVEAAIRSGEPAEQRQKVAELIDLIARTKR